MRRSKIWEKTYFSCKKNTISKPIIKGNLDIAFFVIIN